MKYEVGKSCRIIDNISHHAFEIGTIVEVIDIYLAARHSDEVDVYIVQGLDTYGDPLGVWHVCIEEMESVE